MIKVVDNDIETLSGKGGALLRHPPLETGHAGFPRSSA
jgi:hypothetical protein